MRVRVLRLLKLYAFTFLGIEQFGYGHLSLEDHLLCCLLTVHKIIRKGRIAFWAVEQIHFFRGTLQYSIASFLFDQFNSQGGGGINTLPRKEIRCISSRQCYIIQEKRKISHRVAPGHDPATRHPPQAVRSAQADFTFRKRNYARFCVT